MFIFFFQAEDGIRDGHVTGVQTCALPILAMIVPLKMYHEPILFVTSLVLAVGLALLALWIRFGLEQFQWHPIWRFIISGVVMGCAVSGMHYTAMLAVRCHGTHTTESAQGIWRSEERRVG